MTDTLQNISYKVAIGLLALALLPQVIFAYDAGNDAITRANVDTYANFTIVDTNNSFSNAGNVSEFEFFAKNTNKFRIIVVDAANEVKWVSPEITPTSVGADTYEPVPVVPVQAGWNLAIYSVSTGVIPYGGGGSPAAYEANNAGLPVVGETLTIQGTSGRFYSLNATVETDTDGDGVFGVADKCDGTVADAFPKYGDKTAKNRWMLNASDVWVTNAKSGTMGGFAPTIADTYGCSGTQILDAISAATGLSFGGEYKFGITKGTIEAWMAGEYYMGQGVVDTVVVNAEDTDGSDSDTLEDGAEYLFRASGTANAGDGIDFDADFSFRNSTSLVWSDDVNSYESYGDTLLDLMVDGNFVTWGDNTFQADHVYEMNYVGTGAPVNFTVYDVYYPGNTGSLTVDIIGDVYVDLW